VRVRLNKKSFTSQSGFTLIEVMVVVARITKSKQDIRAMESALNLYKLDNFVYPTTDQGLEALVVKPSGTPEPRNWKKYLDRLSKDAWGGDYQYLSPGSKGDIDIFSFGADGQPGGEDANADIGNWDLQ